MTPTSDPSSGEIPVEGPPCECPLTGLGDLPASAVLEERHPATPHAVRTLRGRLRRWIGALSLDEETADAVVLLVDEAVTNAVEHACSDVDCSVRLTAAPRPCAAGVVVHIADTGHWRPRPDDPGYRGRGVELMGRLAHRSTIVTDREGTTVRLCWGSGSTDAAPDHER